jgi:hypothetical protein
MNSRKRVVRYYKTSVGFALVKKYTVVFAPQKRFTRIGGRVRRGFYFRSRDCGQEPINVNDRCFRCG